MAVRTQAEFMAGTREASREELVGRLEASEERRHHEGVQAQQVIEAMSADLHRVRRQRDGLEQAIAAIEREVGAVITRSRERGLGALGEVSPETLAAKLEWIAATCRDARV